MCDLSRAFVDHALLGRKLESCGVGGMVLKTIMSYLSGRQQVVTVEGATSKPLALNYGVPQGSIVGPLLFLVMINDLDRDGNVVLFADDTTLMSRGTQVEQSTSGAEQHLRGPSRWFEANGFQLNQAKTQSLVCSLARNAPQNESVKLLGFVLDSKLAWRDHIGLVISKLSRVCYLLLKLRNLVTEPYLMTVYHAMFHCHVSYGLLLWGHAPGVDEILRLQKRAARLITFSDHLAHCKPIFARLGILTVFGHYILACIIYVLDNMDDFSPRAAIHGHLTRNRSLFDVPRSRLSRTQKSYTTVAIKLFNKLPSSIKSLDRRSMVRKLVSHLRNRAYYSLEEYFEDPLLDLG